jgi:hypothetical protein
MPYKRGDKVTLAQRVNEVLQLRLLGAEFHDLQQHAQEQNWNVSERQLWRYVAAADKQLEQTLEKDRQKLLNRALAQRAALYARAMSVSDYRTALAVLKDRDELLNLYPPARTELSGPHGGPIPTATVELSDDERAALVAALLARAAAAGPRPDSAESGNDPRPSLGGPGPADDAGGDGAGPLTGDVAPLIG